ncbi:Uncharacterised protein [Lysinibacillus capsici]|uniref:Uncharacterized protein n=1 Tax=Lysinibacillus capsici TaxID=2115968 RepID=A0A2X1BSM3_9BACI|nr:hypothetical protein [Lysinibacillus capsici]SPU37350.1 Uncharacterised protein [Lysinibacillus capsici]
MPLLIIPILLLAIFGLNNISSFILEDEVLFAFGNSFNYLFSWGYLEIDDTKTLAPLYKVLNFMKTLFWILTCLIIIYQLNRRLNKTKAMEKVEK